MKNVLKIAHRVSIALGLTGALVTAAPIEGLARGGMGGMSGMSRHFGGMSASHMSARGLLRTNGPNASDRDIGVAHARSRMSARGLKHSKASVHSHTAVDADHDSDG